MIRHRSILYIAGGMRVRHALEVAPAAENYRVVSAAHRQNALLEFGTDQIDGDWMRNHLHRSVPTPNPERNRPHNPRNHDGVARLSNASLLATALPL